MDTSALQLVRMDLPDSDIWFIKFDIDPLNRVSPFAWFTLRSVLLDVFLVDCERKQDGTAVHVGSYGRSSQRHYVRV